VDTVQKGDIWVHREGSYWRVVEVDEASGMAHIKLIFTSNLSSDFNKEGRMFTLEHEEYEITTLTEIPYWSLYSREENA
jgi:hypothetical protein